LAAFALTGIPSGALAQSQETSPAASDDGGRYSFHRAGDRFIRLDAHTGQVAQCGWSATGWSCNVVPDERAALENEIVRIQKENAALKKSLLSHGIDLPGDVKPDVVTRTEEPPARKEPDASPKLPSEADLDRAIAFMRNVWRRLVELMVDFQRDMQRKS
jgi:hypothetical protein